jgi:hypothetical protein
VVALDSLVGVGFRAEVVEVVAEAAGNFESSRPALVNPGKAVLSKAF